MFSNAMLENPAGAETVFGFDDVDREGLCLVGVFSVVELDFGIIVNFDFYLFVPSALH